MFHLDYLSCFLTILATVLVGRKSWTGLLISIVNSMIVCVIGFRTSQFGFIPANLVCICVYAFSIRSWVKKTHTHRIRQRWGWGPRRRRWSALPTLRSSMTPKLRGSRVAAVLRPRRRCQPITTATLSIHRTKTLSSNKALYSRSLLPKLRRSRRIIGNPGANLIW